MNFDVLIRGGRVVDGTGAARFSADIGIDDDTIVAIDDLSAATANVTLDATDRVVAPGFIDIHSHSDLTLFIYPEALSRTRQGITTEVIGNCSCSPYPVCEEVREYMTPTLAQEPFKDDWRWNDLAGFRRCLEQNGTAVNVVPLVGHASIRITAMGFENRVPSASELKRMQSLAAESMDQGAVGLSTALTLAPGSYAQTEEVVALAKVVAQKGGIYATHSRLWSGFHYKSVEEAIEIGRRAEIPVQISHQTIIDHRYFGQAAKIVGMMEEARASGIDVLYDVYPYTAGGTECDQLLPDFAMEGGPREMLKRLSTPADRAHIRAAVSEGWFQGIPWQWDQVYLAHVAEDNYRRFVGRHIADVAEDLAMDPVDCFLHLIESQQNDVSVVIFNRDEHDVQYFLSHRLAMIGSDGRALSPRGQAMLSKPHPRYYGTYPRILGRYVRELKLLSLEDAVHKMTGAPAARLGLSNRGTLRRGAYADLVVFDPDTVADRATYDEPHQFPVGIEYVLVNGKLVVAANGKGSPLPGRVLLG